MVNKPILVVNKLTRSYQSGDRKLTVLDDISFVLNERDTCSIVGPSGSGKTTLLGLCAGLDRPSSGSITLCGVDLSSQSEDQLAKLRNQTVGFVFQTFRLLPTLTALENVLVPAELRGMHNSHSFAVALLDRVGLKDRMKHYPSQLSGGEQQRVALARAFINKPKVMFADEPTGNLDGKTGNIIVDLLFELNQTANTTLVLVTHDQKLAQKTNRIIQLESGRIASDELRAESVEDLQL